MPDLAQLRTRGKAAVAEALSRVEQDPQAEDCVRLLDGAWQEGQGHVLGITGPPGVGKSTLTGALLRQARDEGLTVAVLAVDPSSRSSGGALLGDRLRLQTPRGDSGCFVRSMAARTRLGGLADEAYPAILLLRALYDLVIVETVGVGQSETDVADMADTVLLCIQPASGDAVQFMKAGIIEIPHIVAVTKADLGAAAERALADVKAALSLAAKPAGFAVESLAVSAHEAGAGAAVLSAVRRHMDFLAAEERRATRRRQQEDAWVEAAIRTDYGRRGLSKAVTQRFVPAEGSPFRRMTELHRALQAAG